MRREKNDAPGYAAFSHYYDAYMSACDMKVWQAYLCAIEDKYGACAKGGVLDLGCGTGNLALPYARAGRDVTGVDLSCDMLSMADEKAYAEGLCLRLLCADMSAFTMGETFSFIYSACDSVNYLGGGRISAFLDRAYGMLDAGGVLTFDFINAQARRAGRERYRLAENKTLTFRRRRRGDILLTDILIHDGAKVFSETHRQYLYTPQEIVERAQRAGFDVCGMFDMMTFEPCKKSSRKVQAVLLKNIK